MEISLENSLISNEQANQKVLLELFFFESLNIAFVLQKLWNIYFTDRTPPRQKHEPFQPPLEDPLSHGERNCPTDVVVDGFFRNVSSYFNLFFV